MGISLKYTPSGILIKMTSGLRRKVIPGNVCPTVFVLVAQASLPEQMNRQDACSTIT
jgi:hypothetical protein